MSFWFWKFFCCYYCLCFAIFFVWKRDCCKGAFTQNEKRLGLVSSSASKIAIASSYHLTTIHVSWFLVFVLSCIRFEVDLTCGGEGRGSMQQIQASVFESHRHTGSGASEAIGVRIDKYDIRKYTHNTCYHTYPRFAALKIKEMLE